MIREDVSLLDVVILVVFAQGVGIWWGSETPFAIAKDYSPEELVRFEKISSAATLTIGLAASLLTRRFTPFVTAGLLCIVLTWFYDYEYARSNGLLESEV